MSLTRIEWLTIWHLDRPNSPLKVNHVWMILDGIDKGFIIARPANTNSGFDVYWNHENYIWEALETWRESYGRLD